eukprot:10973028-Alexandrium_andersonii.AAC.1
MWCGRCAVARRTAKATSSECRQFLVHCKCRQGSRATMPVPPRASVLELLQARPGGAAAQAGEPQGTPEHC